MALQLREYRVWGVLFRLWHWTMALSMAVLAATGLYIHSPWNVTMLEGVHRFPMAEVRMIHMEAAFLLLSALLVRVYLLFFGGRHERLWDFVPVTPRNIRGLFRTMGRYLYLREPWDPCLGHNPLAGTVYFLVILALLFQGLTGMILLFPESPFWQKTALVLAMTQQRARFYHHATMWLLFCFVLIHLYTLVWNEVQHPEGLISSIFSGRKFERAPER